MRSLSALGVALMFLGGPLVCAVESTFGVFVASDEPQQGLRAVRNSYGETFYVRQTPDLDERSIRAVEFSEKDGSPAIRLVFTKNGATVFREVTRRHLHKRLVFIVRGRVVMAPIIDSVSNDDYTWVLGSITKADADALDVAVRKRGRESQ